MNTVVNGFGLGGVFKKVTRILLSAAVLLAAGLRAETPEQIARLSCERDWDNLLLQQQYTFRHTEETKTLDKKGAVKERKTRTRETLWIDGTSYTRLIEKDGKPLSEKDARDEQEKMDKEIAKRRNESPSAKRKRLAEREKELKEEREFRLQIPDAFDWTLLGEEAVGGSLCYKLRAEPKSGFKPRGDIGAKLLPKLHGTIWINKAGYEWVKVDAETLDTISFGLGMVRIGQGARLELEQSQVNGELWFPQWFRVTASARAMLFIGTNVNLLTRFHDFKKYSVDSTLTLTGEAP